MRTRITSDTVQTALSKLGDGRDADGIAAYLRKERIFGAPKSCSLCPVAVYLARQTSPLLSFRITSEFTLLWITDREIVRIINPPAVRDFILNFDRSAYPGISFPGGMRTFLRLMEGVKKEDCQLAR